MKLSTSSRSWFAVTLCSVLLASCGSGDLEIDLDALNETSVEPVEPDTGNSDTGNSDTENSGTGSVKPIEFLLPEATSAPAGFHTIPSKCESGTAANDYRAWHSFAVPNDWEAAGLTSGSSSPTGESSTIGFGTGSDRATVDIAGDIVEPGGVISDGQGGEWTTFDYDYTSQGVSGTIVFEEFATTSVDDQNVTIFAAPHQQAPDFLKVTEYKARLQVAHLYGMWTDGSADTASFVVTIEPTDEAQELDQDTLRGIVGSFALPACAREYVVVQREMSIQQDANGDGHVSTADDYRELTSRP